MVGAAIEIRFTTVNGQDAVSYILSANVNRRNLTKGQRAMAVAHLLVSNNLTQEEAASEAGVSAGRVSQAVAVIAHAPKK